MTPGREPSLFELVRDPPLRTAAFVTAACGLVAFGALFLFRGPVAAGFTAAFAVLALVFRWTWPLGVYLFTVAYFLFLPDGTPVNLGNPSGFIVRYGGFAASDMLLVPAVLAYVVAQFRFLSLAKQAVPYDADSSFGPKAGAVRRPGESLTDRELKWFVGLAVAAMIFGQVVWYFLTRLQFEFLLTIPVRWLPGFNREGDGVTVAPVLNRFMLLVFAGAVAAGVGRLVFWYWGLMQLSREQAVAIVTDAGWHEGRWELAAQERRRGAAKAEADRLGLVTDPPEGAL
jgi:hypothetical protein